MKASKKLHNVLIFCVDQMRADHLGCTGNPVVKTPNLDRLAARGTLFKNACCNNPVCMPARATMFTGLLPRDHGVRVNGHALRKEIPTLPGTLAAAGYRTHSAGKLHLTPWVPLVEPPDTAAFPECMKYWNDGDIQSIPTPYYGFQSVDFVGGHTAYAYGGDYLRWLGEKGGNREMLKPSHALSPAGKMQQCYRMAMPVELHYNRYIADSTIDFVQQCAEVEDAPFFAWCSFPDPHHPVAPPEPYCHMYDPKDIPLPTTKAMNPDTTPAFLNQIFSGKISATGKGLYEHSTPEQICEMIALTYGMISHIDEEVGRVLDALEASGRADDTLVIFISDHGDMMGDHGLLWKGPYTYNGCIRIPMIAAAPGMIGGLTHDGLVSQIDLLPSVLDYCGVSLPGSDWSETSHYEWGQECDITLFPGRSWMPMLEDAWERIHNEIVIENDTLSTGYATRCLVTEDHRLTVYPGTGDGELFDQKNDPGEHTNLWYSEKHRALRDLLVAQLLDAYSRCTPQFPVPPWCA